MLIYTGWVSIAEIVYHRIVAGNNRGFFSCMARYSRVDKHLASLPSVSSATDKAAEEVRRLKQITRQARKRNRAASVGENSRNDSIAQLTPKQPILHFEYDCHGNRKTKHPPKRERRSVQGSSVSLDISDPV